MSPEYSAESLNLIVQHTNDAVLEMDGEGCIHSINPRFSAVFGFQPDEILNQNVLTVLAELALTVTARSKVTVCLLPFTIFRPAEVPPILPMVAQQPSGGVGHGTHLTLSGHGPGIQ